MLFRSATPPRQEMVSTQLVDNRTTMPPAGEIELGTRAASVDHTERAALRRGPCAPHNKTCRNQSAHRLLGARRQWRQQRQEVQTAAFYSCRWNSSPLALDRCREH